MAQTPEQRKRNQMFLKSQDAKRGRSATVAETKQKFKSPISPVLAGGLAFLILGGLVFELLNRIFVQ